ncbi:MAG: FG-GAP repeat protein, partial [Pirellulaceae bacterium]|nr:FG-GAP repeat protein [Pirellulaceae bacterium]
QDWYQSFPADPGTYTETLISGELSANNNFGNFRRDIIVIGPDKTNRSLPFVHVYDVASGELLSRFLGLPLTPDYRGGVRIATGDLDGDGIDEIITAPGRNTAPQVYVFKLVGGEWVEQVGSRFLAFDAKFKGGVDLAIGNVNGDEFPNGLPKNDIIASMSYGGNEVRVFLNTTASPISFAEDRGSFERFQPYGKLKGGATVRVADMGTMSAAGLDQTSLDGSAEIIVGNGAGLRSTVYVYGYNVVDSNPNAQRVKQFQPFSSKFKGGISLDIARVDPDNIPDIIVGTSNRGGSMVTVLNGISGAPTITEFAAFTKNDLNPGAKKSFNAPVRATALDSDGDGRADYLLAYQGTDGKAGMIRKFDLDKNVVDEILAGKFDPMKDFLDAYFVSTLKTRSTAA